MIKHENRAHALLSASGSSRWLNCTPSPRLEEKEGFQKSSSYAQEGTLAHEFTENEIRYKYGMVSEKEYEKIKKRIVQNDFFDQDFKDHCWTYIDYVVGQFESSKVRSGNTSTLIIEERVDFSEFVENGFGTSDASVLEPDILEVIDLKFGKGIPVSPVKNTQGMLYGLGSLKNNEMLYEFKTLRITIVQPRLDHITSWDISIEDLLEWAENELRTKAELAYEGVGELNPGDWCRFCKVKHKCPAMRDLALSEAKEDFAPEKFMDEIEMLTDAEIIESYEKFKTIEDWMSSVTAHLLQSAIEGKKWKGYKLVEGKSNRKLIETDALIEELKRMKVPKKNFIIEKLISMTEMEKFLKKRKPALIEKHIIKPEGSPNFVPESDGREEWNKLSAAQNDFAEDLEIDELLS